MISSANVGSTDRIIRIVAGLVLLALPWLMAPVAAWLAWGAPIVGIVLIATAFLRFCPAYSLLGMRTNSSS